MEGFLIELADFIDPPDRKSAASAIAWLLKFHNLSDVPGFVMGRAFARALGLSTEKPVLRTEGGKNIVIDPRIIGVMILTTSPDKWNLA